MNKFANVWVFSDNAARFAELIGGARELGEKVQVFVTQEQKETVLALGADAIYTLSGGSGLTEDYADTLAHCIAQGGGHSLVLLPATRRGKAMAARLGARLNAGVCNDVSVLRADQSGALATHMVYGGLALGEERLVSPVAIVTLGSGTFAPAAPVGGGEEISPEFIAPRNPITCLERRAKQGSNVDLGKAKRVVSVGRGIGNQENIALAGQLSAAIGAELGCSRPVAENEKWMERERYVGISGIMIKPELYLALGISGQIQHMVGANGAQIIAAVNRDKNAPIFQHADYGIVGDLFKIVPVLVRELNK
ncbi:FAD-binding protein [Enterobacillus tribolii]|nr:FAD-binding protein [Enterobacillus tribolii]MBW7983653.1 electron transfer flavoprotein subunit alpha [Enterobacillus tribolii]